MPVTAKIKFTQGLSNPPPGEALVGVLTTAVVCTNENDSNVAEFTWEVIDKPPGSTVPGPGVVLIGAIPTFQFNPDLEGGYHIHLRTKDTAGNFADDFRVFQVPEPSGHLIPPFNAAAAALNFAGQTRGWAKSQEELLRYLLASSGGGVPVTNVTTSPFAVPDSNAHLAVDSTGGVRVLNLPASPTTTRKLEIKDSFGQSAVNNITINGNGKNIDGVASRVLSIAFASLTIIYNGTQWSIV